MLGDEGEDERKLKTTEMRMLHMLCGRTLKDKVSNDKTCEMMRMRVLVSFPENRSCDSWREWTKKGDQ